MAPSSRVRLKDVAQRVKLSVSTVSMALTNHPDIKLETRRRVQRVSNEMGYRARSTERDGDPLAGKRVGMLFVGTTIPTLSVIQEFAVCIRGSGARLELAASPERDPRVAEAMLPEFVDGLSALVLIGYVDHDLLLKAQALDVPCVLCGHMMHTATRSPRPYGLAISGDDIQMAACAAATLRTAGHRRLGFIAEPIVPGLWLHRWQTGFRLHHLELGLPAEHSWEYTSAADDVAGAEAAAALAKMPESQRPTGFVIPEPTQAARFLEQATQRGLSISRRAVVLGKEPVRAHEAALADLPRIYIDDHRFANALLDALQRACSGNDDGSLDLVVQPTIEQMPAGG